MGDQPDVLSQGDDRERWRPSRRLVVLGVVVAVVAGAAASALAWQRHERDLDRRAAAAVSLSLAGFDDQAAARGLATGYPLLLVNDADTAVSLVDAELVGPGYRPSRTALRLRAHTTRSVVVRPGTGCDLRLYASPPTGVRVTVRTSRGRLVHRTLPLIGDSLQILQSQERSRCGLGRPAEALLLEPQAAVRHGRDVRVTFRAFNSSRFALTVDSITAPPGVSLLGRPSFTLPGTFGSTTDLERQVVVTLHLTSCAALESAWEDQSIGIQPGGGLPDVFNLVVRVANGREAQRARVPLQQPSEDAPSTDATALLLRSCDHGVAGPVA